MTYADQDFIPEGQEESPSYPTAFGITFTPRVSGIIFAVLGLLGSMYLLLNVIQPAWENYQKLESTVADKRNQIQQQEKIQKEIKDIEAKLEQAKQKNKQVLNLYANEKTLDTLLLDLNGFVKSRNGTMTNFTPEKEAPTGANAAASQTPVNGKLKRKTYNIEFEGNFDQIQSILRSFERLQSLLLVKNFKAEVKDDQGLQVNVLTGKSVPAVFKKDENNKVVPGGKPSIKTKFNLEVLLPVTEADTKEAATQPGKKAK